MGKKREVGFLFASIYGIKAINRPLLLLAVSIYLVWEPHRGLTVSTIRAHCQFEMRKERMVSCTLFF